LVRIEGDEAQHAARVKRVRSGERVELLDGAGLRASGVVAQAGTERRECWVDVDVGDVTVESPVTPRVEVWSPAPKGDRLEVMIDQLSQNGAAVWVPVISALTERELTDKRRVRLERVAREAMKQCGRAWALEIDRPLPADAAWTSACNGPVLIADASGVKWNDDLTPDADTVRWVIGPEGGWTEAELASARGAGARVVALGPHIMRIGTAAVLAAGVTLARGIAGDAHAGSG
jgi:16S rRNA (uracil1498-N3)-methyltransferase